MTIVKDPKLEEISNQYGLEIVSDLSDFPYVRTSEQCIPYEFCKAHNMLPVGEEDGKILVATSDPLELEAVEELRYLLEKEVKELLVPLYVLEQAIEKCYQQKENVASELISGVEKKEEESSEGHDLLSQKVDSPVIRMLNAILIEAIQEKASDVHFEPLEKGLSVRYRIDGVLQMRHSPPKEYQAQLLTRIKVMAKLDIAEQRLPQDGRIKLLLSGQQIDFRVSTIPVVFGERIVLRILDKRNVVVGMNKIGMSSEILETIREKIRLTEGIILVTGPTGSGKTTTLYSALSEINSSEVNIITVENPVEYKLPGIAQIEVNPKINLTFAMGLRHILRQDPDVIMIGEIRDPETAEIAIQASLTGHLVLSTLHTNDAPSAITRLVDMGIEPYLLSSSIVAVLAQRLVRTICPHCRISYSPSKAELKQLDLNEPVLYRGEGCPECFGCGYKGRRAIYELMIVSEEIQSEIVRNVNASSIKRIAFEEGMKSLRSQGIELVCQGITTSKEVLRVTR